MKNLDEITIKKIKRCGVMAVDAYDDAVEMKDAEERKKASLTMKSCLEEISQMSGIEIKKVEDAFENRERNEHVFGWTETMLVKEGLL